MHMSKRERGFFSPSCVLRVPYSSFFHRVFFFSPLDPAAIPSMMCSITSASTNHYVCQAVTTFPRTHKSRSAKQRREAGVSIPTLFFLVPSHHHATAIGGKKDAQKEPMGLAW